MMFRSAKFWIPMAAFQFVFGVAIFSITRHYYLPDADAVSADPTVTNPPVAAWPDPTTETTIAQLGSPTIAEPTADDPSEISRQADEFFANRQFDRAVVLYERLMALAPENVETYNNLGITLHYLGRSAEALSKLNEGTAIDPTHQRIWLTLGFVNSQSGNIEQARIALSTAAQMDAGNEVGRSAAQMLENLR